MGFCICVAHLYTWCAFECEYGCALNRSFTFFSFLFLPYVQVERIAFLRYSYSEIHVHLRVDVLQSARAQRDAVADLCQKGLLTPEVVNSFGVVCCQAMQKVCQLRKLPWQVVVCSWGEDEERDREMRLVVHSWALECLQYAHNSQHWSLFVIFPLASKVLGRKASCLNYSSRSMHVAVCDICPYMYPNMYVMHI